MRLLYWILGAAATSLAGAFVLKTRIDGRRKALTGEFLHALERDAVTIERDEPHIAGPGLRGDLFHGEADGQPFAFRAIIDASGVGRHYVLLWSGHGEAAKDQQILMEGDGHGLPEIHLGLLRLRARRGGDLTN